MQKYNLSIVYNGVLEKHLSTEFNFVIVWNACLKKAYFKRSEDIVWHTLKAPLIILLPKVIG